MNHKKLILVNVFFTLGFLYCFSQETMQPTGLKEQGIITLEVGDIKAVIADNKAIGAFHRAGYNGIAELYHSLQDSTLFVPLYAGFNLEHIFGGDSLKSLFEPREHPMSLYHLNDSTALLYQSPTPISRVESLTEFRFTKPHCIDVVFKCRVMDDHFFKHDYTGLFWASYINAPSDKKIYFKGQAFFEDQTKWIGAYSERHGEKSTHAGIYEQYDFYFAPNFNARLASHFSDYSFEEPFYYGRFHNMVLIYMFETDQVIRFSQSPTGGGQGNPAWDFQFLIPNPIVGKIYSYRARVVYKPFVSREDVVEEYLSWREGE